MTDLQDLAEQMRVFAEERDWVKFHDPKSLLLALTGEVGEVAELLQWLPADATAELAREEPLRTRLAEELGDVQLYLTRLADACGIDLARAAADKLEAGRQRFPADRFKGQAPLRS